MGKWRERFEVAKDTVADAKFKATEPFVRCKAKNADGKQCQLNRGHKNPKKHEHGRERW